MRTWAGLFLLLFFLPLSAFAGESVSPDQRFAQLADEFWRGYLALSPITATGVGYHVGTDPATGKSVRLDEQLDDVSPAGIDRQRQFFLRFRARFEQEAPPSRLDAETRADYDLIHDLIELGLLDLDRIQSYRHKPQVYVEAIGSAIFTPLVLDYAPPEVRLQHILARLEKVPAFLATARENLVDTAPIFLKTAVEENQGNIGIIQGALKRLVPDSGPLAERYQKDSAEAVAALEAFNHWLETDFQSKATGDWRLGKKLYDIKFRYELGTDVSPEELLRDAETQLIRVRAEMLALALPLHQQWFPDHGGHGDLKGEERENRVIGEVLDHIAQDHPTADHLVAAVRGDVSSLEKFLAEKQVVSMPGRGNLQVIETPAFLRGLYGVAAFQSAPPLEPKLGAFFYVTPIPDNWTAEQADSKLREYNSFMLKILTIHEALPGHYVQFEHAANIEPEWRRVLRSVFGNTPYIEGWATYAQDVVLDAGYLDGDPRLRLTDDKMLLRVLANAILDIRLQTGEMTEPQALDLMINHTFQEKAEAEAKFRRAQLSSAQLPTYFVGWREWWRLRHDVEKREGKNFSLRDFHDRALAAGAVNLRSLRRLLLP